MIASHFLGSKGCPTGSMGAIFSSSKIFWKACSTISMPLCVFSSPQDKSARSRLSATGKSFPTTSALPSAYAVARVDAVRLR